LLAVLFDVTGADIGIVLFERLHHGVEGEAECQQPRRVGRDMELLLESADGVDLGDTCHLPQLRPDHPVLQGAQRRSVIGLTIGLACLVVGVNRVQKNLAQTGRDRPHLRLYATRQLTLGLLQALVDQIAGPVDVGAVFEHHRHLRQAVARQRTGVFQLRQAGDRNLDQIGDALFDFERRIAGCRGIDLHLHIGDVRHGVDRQALVIPDADGADRQHQKQHDPAAGNGET
jgi:hypothetical protein